MTEDYGEAFVIYAVTYSRTRVVCEEHSRLASDGVLSSRLGIDEVGERGGIGQWRRCLHRDQYSA